jgi:hypothetical protein
MMAEGSNDVPAVRMPTRGDVEACWLGVLGGAVSREEAHNWAARWVESAELSQIPDIPVRTALQYLHGYDLVVDMTHPENVWHAAEDEQERKSRGAYRRSLDEIAHDLDRWRAGLQAYDADPQAALLAARNRSWEELRRVDPEGYAHLVRDRARREIERLRRDDSDGA